jgi:hypothetical protein
MFEGQFGAHTQSLKFSHVIALSLTLKPCSARAVFVCDIVWPNRSQWSSLPARVTSKDTWQESQASLISKPMRPEAALSHLFSRIKQRPSNVQELQTVLPTIHQTSDQVVQPVNQADQKKDHSWDARDAISVGDHKAAESTRSSIAFVPPNIRGLSWRTWNIIFEKGSHFRRKYPRSNVLPLLCCTDAALWKALFAIAFNIQSLKVFRVVL